jgi:hypothetical protein
MVDILVLFTSIASLLVFVFSLAHWIRVNGENGILLTIKRLFLVISGVSSFFLWFMAGGISLLLRIELLFIHILLFWSLSFAYIIGLFGLPLTSLRIQLLLMFARRREHGMTLVSLTRRYGIKEIVRQRLNRLETSGEIARRGEVYALRSKWTYFMIHTYVLLFLTWVYRPIPWKNKTV